MQSHVAACEECCVVQASSLDIVKTFQIQAKKAKKPKTTHGFEPYMSKIQKREVICSPELKL